MPKVGHVSTMVTPLDSSCHDRKMEQISAAIWKIGIFILNIRNRFGASIQLCF